MLKTTQYLPAIEGGMPVRPKSKFLVFGAPKIEGEEIKEVVNSLKSGWIGTGPKVAKFEELIRKFVGAKYAIAVNSCTAGLHLSLLATGIKPGDEVITTPLTFAATVNVIEHVGAKPILADIELPSMNIDPYEIEKKITQKTKAIIPVHFAGRPCQMEKILKLAKKYKLKIIEDAAHAFGAEYKGKKIGTISDLTVFSFYATKNITTGEGGIVTTNNEKYANFIRSYSHQGLSANAWKRYSDEGFKHYLVEAPGYKYNMTDLQAAIGIHQFRRFHDNQKRRVEIWEMYNKAFSNLPLVLPPQPQPGTKHAYHLYTILINTKSLNISRDTVQQALHYENIGTGIHFTAIHLHPYYRKKYGFKKGDFPNSEYISDRTISLPLSPKLTNKDVKDVIKAVTKILRYYQEYKPTLKSSP